MAYTMYVDQQVSVADICQTLRISQATFYRYVAVGKRAAERRVRGVMARLSLRRRRERPPWRRCFREARRPTQHGGLPLPPSRALARWACRPRSLAGQQRAVPCTRVTTDQAAVGRGVRIDRT